MRTHYLLASLALACAIPAQTTWLIGPSGHAEIRDVMQLVQDGDTVLVDAGNYFNFDCDKAVTIRAATPGTVTVNFNLASLPSGCGCQCLATKGPTRLQPPPGKSMHIVDIAFGAYQSITPCFSLLAHQVQVTSGRVTFDDCTIDRLSITGAAVHLQDCTIVSQLAGPAIEATQADITIVGGQVTGSNKSSQFLANNAYDGIKTIDSRLHASHVVVTGGDPLTSTIGTFGIHAIGGSLWLSDAAVTGNMQCAVQATGLVRIDRSTLAGSGANCASSPTGASLQGIQRQGGIEIGAMFQCSMTGQTGELQVFYGSTKLGVPLVISLVDQPIWIDPTQLFFTQLGIAGTSGQSTFAFAVPPVPVLVGETFWVQGVGGASFPLQTTPVVGGVVR
tara:strand:- start:786 stop:1958 length:1173 start_codon:yes stop_codon:yes gene_type:complete